MTSNRGDLTADDQSKYAILFYFYFHHMFNTVIERVPYVNIQKEVHTDG